MTLFYYIMFYMFLPSQKIYCLFINSLLKPILLLSFIIGSFLWRNRGWEKFFFKAWMIMGYTNSQSRPLLVIHLDVSLHPPTCLLHLLCCLDLHLLILGNTRLLKIGTHDLDIQLSAFVLMFCLDLIYQFCPIISFWHTWPITCQKANNIIFLCP
jgi:hypothetical protein